MRAPPHPGWSSAAQGCERGESARGGGGRGQRGPSLARASEFRCRPWSARSAWSPPGPGPAEWRFRGGRAGAGEEGGAGSPLGAQPRPAPRPLARSRDPGSGLHAAVAEPPTSRDESGGSPAAQTASSLSPETQEWGEGAAGPARGPLGLGSPPREGRRPEGLVSPERSAGQVPGRGGGAPSPLARWRRVQLSAKVPGRRAPPAAPRRPLARRCALPGRAPSCGPSRRPPPAHRPRPQPRSRPEWLIAALSGPVDPGLRASLELLLAGCSLVT